MNEHTHIGVQERSPPNVMGLYVCSKVVAGRFNVLCLLHSVED